VGSWNVPFICERLVMLTMLNTKRAYDSVSIISNELLNLRCCTVEHYLICYEQVVTVGDFGRLHASKYLAPTLPLSYMIPIDGDLNQK
jgi:hypothetical protein